jgi:hypothetical protein
MASAATSATLSGLSAPGGKRKLVEVDGVDTWVPASEEPSEKEPRLPDRVLQEFYHLLGLSESQTYTDLWDWQEALDYFLTQGVGRQVQVLLEACKRQGRQQAAIQHLRSVETNIRLGKSKLVPLHPLCLADVRSICRTLIECLKLSRQLLRVDRAGHIIAYRFNPDHWPGCILSDTGATPL